MHVHMPPALITITKEHQTYGITLGVAQRDFDCYSSEVARVAGSLEQELCPPVQDSLG